MKKQIRKGVFETNSSSTHSVTIGNKSLEETKEIVKNRILNAYGDSYDRSFDIGEYLRCIPGTSNDYKFILKGFELESGDEEKNVYYIMCNWVAKIQYLAMILKHYNYKIEGINKSTYNIKNTETYKAFENLIKQYGATKGFNIKEIELNINNYTYIEDIKDTDKHVIFNIDNDITPDTINNLFSMIMLDDYIITYCDEAYSPYIPPQIYIL